MEKHKGKTQDSVEVVEIFIDIREDKNDYQCMC